MRPGFWGKNRSSSSTVSLDFIVVQIPVLRTVCDRTAFQEQSTDLIRISLDTHLHMIPEMDAPRSPGDWCRDERSEIFLKLHADRASSPSIILIRQNFSALFIVLMQLVIQPYSLEVTKIDEIQLEVSFLISLLEFSPVKNTCFLQGSGLEGCTTVSVCCGGSEIAVGENPCLDPANGYCRSEQALFWLISTMEKSGIIMDFEMALIVFKTFWSTCIPSCILQFYQWSNTTNMPFTHRLQSKIWLAK